MALHAERAARCTSRIADALPAALPARRRGARARRAARARAAPPGTRLLWAHARLGRLSGADRPRAAARLGAAGSIAVAARSRALARLLRDRRDRRRALRASSWASSAATIAIGPASGTRRSPAPSACGARWSRRGMTARRPPRRARRRRRRRPRGLLRGDLPARRAGRAGADDARRAGRLRLRRQDRRRPAGGEELRRRLPPAGGRARRSRHARNAAAAELAAGWVEVLKTALIAGGELWERVGRRRGRRADDPRVRAHEARGRRRGRARRAAAARC